jgi:hypothetical protein
MEDHLYSYAPLEAHDSIRILDLDPVDPENEDAEVWGSLVTTSLENLSVPFYEALSYAWGSPHKTHELQTPDGVIPITASLHAALIDIREKDVSLLLWIDAVCINQVDNEEKSAQVQLMGQIYAQATHVLVYLGPAADDSLRAVQLLTHIKTLDLKEEIGLGSHRQKYINGLRMSLVPPTTDEGWTAVRALLRRPWFRRIWVVQEFVMAKSVRILCGNEWNVCWRTIFDPLKQLVKYNVPSLFKPPDGNGDVDAVALLGWDCFDRMVTTRDAAAEGKRFPFDFLPFMFRRAEATDPRDHLFALIGLASVPDVALNPNYNETVEEAVLRFGRRSVEVGRAVQLLQYAGAGPHCARFPSWIPDWVLHNRAKPIPINWHSSGEPCEILYAAGGAGSSRAGFATDSSIGSDHLFIRGCIIDTVTKVGQPYHERPLPPSAPPGTLGIRGVLNCLRSAEGLLDTQSAYPTGEAKRDVLWRTLIADKTGEGPRAGQDVKDSFHSFEKFLAEWAESQEVDNPELHQLEDQMDPYYASFILRMKHRRPCLTKKGFFGIVPEAAQPGHVICVILGAPLPFVFEKGTQFEDAFRVVGHCYIHGMAQGEALAFHDFDGKMIRLY